MTGAGGKPRPFLPFGTMGQFPDGWLARARRHANGGQDPLEVKGGETKGGSADASSERASPNNDSSKVSVEAAAEADTWYYFETPAAGTSSSSSSSDSDSDVDGGKDLRRRLEATARAHAEGGAMGGKGAPGALGMDVVVKGPVDTAFIRALRQTTRVRRSGFQFFLQRGMSQSFPVNWLKRASRLVRRHRGLCLAFAEHAFSATTTPPQQRYTVDGVGLGTLLEDLQISPAKRKSYQAWFTKMEQEVGGELHFDQFLEFLKAVAAPLTKEGFWFYQVRSRSSDARHRSPSSPVVARRHAPPTAVRLPPNLRCIQSSNRHYFSPPHYDLSGPPG